MPLDQVALPESRHEDCSSDLWRAAHAPRRDHGRQPALGEGRGGPVKDIDLVIRTSGERRISGFFPWQSQRAEIVFSDKMWPAFDEHDLDEALAKYALRRAAVTG
ncbi:MAG TPA: undecaprenyl diphosphate synthase family protein [Flexivirga sp.]|uniref:undecaprenyl diphosphate synthase family protein n=1 Tax=Flexivirga sp. TaxID=1962927 RepID=UPI002CE72174|nr:undecaprenyl diphosphate synthase family protein [Flexivirga sp.]HWC24567.1 undecaprenyl diphosphate synthase family protein [Flexivirga sp.]